MGEADGLRGDRGNGLASAEFLVHFVLEQDLHAMDAVVLNKCEAEMLALIKEVAYRLDVGVRVESRAYGEGGLECYLIFIGRHLAALTFLSATLTTLCGGGAWLFYQRTLTNQQIEQNDLNLQKTRLELKKLAREDEEARKADSGVNAPAQVLDQKALSTSSSLTLPLEEPPTIDDVARALVATEKVTRRRSQFYRLLLSEPTVLAVGFAESHGVGRKESVVQRAHFGSLIVDPRTLSPHIVEDAEIEIVAPILKQGPYKWRGAYEGQQISFDLTDMDFRDAVSAGRVQFRHGTSIRCVLEIHLRENEAGEVEVVNRIVTQVRAISRFALEGASNKGEPNLIRPATAGLEINSHDQLFAGISRNDVSTPIVEERLRLTSNRPPPEGFDF